MKLIKECAYKSYSLCLMQESDFCFVKSFLDGQRDRLERIEFFYPYKDEELRNILAQGAFWGLLDKDRLIATFGIDSDTQYAQELARLINSFRDLKLDKAYESSGLMVDAQYRGKGVAGFMLDVAEREAEKRKIALCGVVHTENAASMSTFFSRGFELRALWHMCDDYDFVYLLKRYDQQDGNYSKLICDTLLQIEKKRDIISYETEAVDCRDSRGQAELLRQGFCGIKFEKNRIIFVREKEKKL